MNENDLCETCIISISYISGYRCSICSKPLVYKQELCDQCEAESAFVHKSLGSYKGMLADILRLYKKKSYLNLADILARMVFEGYEQWFEGYTVVPVPYHFKKLQNYKEDGVDRICRILSKKYTVPVQRVLLRSSYKNQKSQNRAERLQMEKNTYRLRNACLPKKILLFDDVYTTGATLKTCHKAFEKHTGIEIAALTIAMNH